MAETDFDRLTRVRLGEFKRVHERSDEQDARFDEHDQRFDRIDEELRAIRSEIKSIRTHVLARNDPKVRTLLRRCLEGEGFSVFEAKNSHETKGSSA